MRPYFALALSAALALAILAAPLSVAASTVGGASRTEWTTTTNAYVTQSKKSDSARFVGRVTIDGSPAPEAATIVARVGETNCGFGVVANGWYHLDVVPNDAKDGCGRPGATVVFLRGSLGERGNLPIGPAGAWNSTRENYLDLSFTTPATRPESLPVMDTDLAPWLLGALGAVALLFGTVLERRRPSRSS